MAAARERGDGDHLAHLVDAHPRPRDPEAVSLDIPRTVPTYPTETLTNGRVRKALTRGCRCYRRMVPAGTDPARNDGPTVVPPSCSKDESMAPSTPAAAPTEDRVRPDDIDLVVDELALRLAAATDDHERAELRERMVLAGLPLADSVARRYQGRGIETDDLVQVARTALVKAVRRYRPGAGPGFAAYAAATICRRGQAVVPRPGRAVRPPRRIQELRAGLVVEEERLRHVLLRDPLDQSSPGCSP